MNIILSNFIILKNGSGLTCYINLYTAVLGILSVRKESIDLFDFQ